MILLNNNQQEILANLFNDLMIYTENDPTKTKDDIIDVWNTIITVMPKEKIIEYLEK